MFVKFRKKTTIKLILWWIDDQQHFWNVRGRSGNSSTFPSISPRNQIKIPFGDVNIKNVKYNLYSIIQYFPSISFTHMNFKAL